MRPVASPLFQGLSAEEWAALEQSGCLRTKMLSFRMGHSKHGFLYHYFNMANSNPQYLNFEMTNADKK